MENINEKPNIILILCDDLGYADVGFNGGDEVFTPNLDKLAGDGTIFSDAYVNHPFCGPSRTSIMTGRYAHKIGAQFNLPHNNQTGRKGVDTTEVFISKALKEAGYFTGAIGKWHLGKASQYHPNNRGFDEFYGFLGGGHKYFPDEFLAKYDQQRSNGNKDIWDYIKPLEYNGKTIRDSAYITDALSREAVNFVNKASEKEKPFFLYLAYNAPHVPLEAKDEDIEEFSTIEDEDRRVYAAMVYGVDRGVGELEKALIANGQLDNTLIVFLSDNGGKTTRGANNYPLREGKGSTCEGGYRTPMFFHWPGVVPAGKVFEHPVTTLDFYPTFAGLASAIIPQGKVLDGKNIWNDFMNNQNPHKEEMILCMRHRTGYTDVGARKGKWKALKTDQNAWKLYDIEKDISEENDLSQQYPDVLMGLVSEAEKWSRSNIQPRWFHDIQTGIEWKMSGMPHFEKTFSIE